VLYVLMHELVHAVVGTDDDHGERFGQACKALGLTFAGVDNKGEWPTQAFPDLALQEELDAIAGAADGYPHAALNPPPPPPPQIVKAPPSVPSLIKVVCPDCGYVARITTKWAVRGLPLCGVCPTKRMLLKTEPEA
jgi:hypothetical protein